MRHKNNPNINFFRENYQHQELQLLAMNGRPDPNGIMTAYAYIADVWHY